MSITITELTRLPKRRDKQIGVGGVSITGGVKGVDYGTSQTFYNVTLSGFTTGSSVNPSIFFTVDTNTGFYRPIGDTIGVAIGGAETARFDSTGGLVVKDNITGFSSIYSDVRLKDDIKNIYGALDIIKKLQGIMYRYKVDEQTHFGLSAQDIQKIIPEVVIETDVIGMTEKYLAIRYTEIIPFLIESIKELEKKVHQLEQDLNYYKNYNS